MLTTKTLACLYSKQRPSIILSILIVQLFWCLCGCKKLVEIDPPKNELTTTDVFTDSATANSVVAGMYSFMYNYNSDNYQGGSPYKNYITTLSGLTSDETYFFSGSIYPQFEKNAIPVADSRNLQLWTDSYKVIYMANNIIEQIGMLSASTAEYRNQINGEALFMRAFCLFYLTNLFGDVPIVTTTDIAKTALLPRAPQAEVYQQIVTDFKTAQNLLAEDYQYGGGERTRVNKYAATAMLARVYLYLRMFPEAEAAAGLVINHQQMYKVETKLDRVFLSSSSEAILQFHTNVYGAPYVVRDFLPSLASNIPNFVLSDDQLAAFEPTDLRQIKWIGSVNYGGKNYHYPFKYKLDGVSVPSPEQNEYEMVLRLTEQYLIRAEARAQLNDLDGAKSDLDAIRFRADVPEINISTKENMINSVEHERQVELFCEWGHRWLDLKRTNKANLVLGTLKPTWKSTAALFPIPQKAITSNKNLKQNPGYN